ncbi:methyl-accepting chemotaxis protein [Litchfieldia salsa]|uniref:Methyl-accepting chemotaxis sensory transducer with Cache sensor n=1 Tax=Litchfieldia salsa TaxID=930152 RepID=A0A1H0W5C7_9BACI|nr:methyl-accepting chemotaxis protein [Litchfieldia salsa]SDP85909.1 methyl-accepting chemotaxis sensory transducer with Cache sensor [Litchfieldia salsa]
MRKKKSSIQFKMLSIFLPIILISTISITALSFFSSKKEITTLTSSSVNNKMDSVLEAMEHEFTAHTRLAQSLSTLYKVKGNSLTKEDYQKTLEETIALNENTFGLGIWIDPYKYNADSQYFGPYVYRDAGSIVYTEDYETAEYNYPEADWYVKGKEVGEGNISWSPPYYDEALDMTLLTASVPIFQDGAFAGVITADYDLTTIQNLIVNQKFEQTGHLFLVGKAGEFIAHKEKAMTDHISDDSDLKELGQAIEESEQGVQLFETNGKEWEAFYTTFPDTGWKLVSAIPTSELYDGVNSLLTKSVWITAFFLLASATLIYLFSASLSKKIKQFVEKIGYLAEGDLSSPMELKSNDELGQMSDHYNRALSNLNQMFHTIRSSSEQVAASSEELSASAEQTSGSVAEVANSIQEVAANINQQNNYTQRVKESTTFIHKGMEQINDNIEKVKHSSTQTTVLAQSGTADVKSAIEQMKEIDSTVQQTSNSINNLDNKSKQIEEIVGLINTIAQQTNLLALNAAIEAARAGEHGKGFAVVADEVRKLAEQSSQASGDIKQLIHEIQDEISISVTVMKSSTESTKSGIQVVGQTGQSFSEIYEAIESMTKHTEEVYDSIVYVLKEVDQMKDVVESVNEIAVTNDEQAQNVSAATEEQAAMVEEMTASSEALAQIATELQMELGKFKL